MHAVVFSNIIPGNIIIQNQVNLDNSVINVKPLLDFVNNILVEINCDSSVNSINSAVEEYKNILLSIKPYILNQLSGTSPDFVYKTQLSRLLEIINYMINILPNLNIKAACISNIALANILFWLYENPIELINILNILNGLIVLNPDCRCISNAIFALFIGKITNYITVFQSSINSLVKLINVVILTDSNSYIKSYDASYIPKVNYIVNPKIGNTSLYSYSNKTRWC
ncbi:MAG: hypothetical protein ACRC92_25480 [Peptostreptococcaceae bacterium]